MTITQLELGASDEYLPTPIPAKTSADHIGRFERLDADKLRGGYYTTGRLAKWLADWAIRTPDDRILEPSCGDGAFLASAAQRLLELGTPSSSVASQLRGIEIIDVEADKARARILHAIATQLPDVVVTGDYFSWWQQGVEGDFDAVIGNPPFIRYQSFPDPHRGRAMDIMASLGLRPNRLTNIWVPFVASATAKLRPGGRIAMVLPAELLQVSYASQLRGFLVDHFTEINIVACNELFFEGAEQEVVLLLAEGSVPHRASAHVCRVALTESHSVDEIVERSPEEVLSGASPKTVHHDQEKWLKYFLDPVEISLMRELRENLVATPLRTHAKIDVGVVTGKNDFFVLNSHQVGELGLHDFTTPIISRTMQLRGARISAEEWETLALGSDRVHLLDLAPQSGASLPSPLASYLRRGEELGVPLGYKCSIRRPWYAVPSTWIPDGFFFRQIHDFPRPVLNDADATSTDTIHRLRCKDQPQQTIANLYTHLTAASAEIEGRSYGGGVLELEPTEAERLLMPAALRGALPIEECDRLIRSGKLTDVLAENDRIVLQDGMGLSAIDCARLRGIWIKMRDRRSSRRRGTRRLLASKTTSEQSR